MSNDTTYRLKLRHPKKSRLEEIKTYLTVVKPELCRFVQNMKLDPRLSEQKSLNLLGIKKWSEVVTWFGSFSSIDPKISRVRKDDDFYEFEISAWANENGANVWISGPDGELSDLIERFPNLEIGGKYFDDYGVGRVSGFEKIYIMSRLEYQMDDSNWDSPEYSNYSMATRELLISDHGADIDLEELRRLLREGADVNAKRHGFSYISRMASNLAICGDYVDKDNFAKCLALILKSGWRYDSQDTNTRQALVCIAQNLLHEEKAIPVRMKMVQIILGRKERKNEDAQLLFSQSINTRNVNGLLAAAFLGVDFSEEVEKQSELTQTWLQEEGFSEDWIIQLLSTNESRINIAN